MCYVVSRSMIDKKRRGAGRGRVPLKVKPGFGEAVYRLMGLNFDGKTGLAWKTEQLAKALKVSQDTARRWIGGKLPRAKQLLPLARVLHTSTDDLLIADETGDISHISALPEQIRTSAAERISAVVSVSQKQKDRKGKPR